MSRGVGSSKNGTVVDEIVASLCHAIFRGEHEVGMKLPPLRTLAQTYGVTLPTMQRVIARMEELGVIRARQGSGVTVLDPHTHASPAAMVFWLDVLREDPAAAVKFVKSFLLVRRELGVSVLMNLRQGLTLEERTKMKQTIDHFAERVEEGVEAEEAAELDFEVMRAWLALRPQVAIGVIMNMLEQLTLSSQEMLQAAYDRPERNVMGYRAVYEAFIDEGVNDQAFREQVISLLTTFDMVSMAKFEAILSR